MRNKPPWVPKNVHDTNLSFSDRSIKVTVNNGIFGVMEKNQAFLRSSLIWSGILILNNIKMNITKVIILIEKVLVINTQLLIL